MEQEEAKEIAKKILNSKLQTRRIELSEIAKHSKKIYKYVYRIATKKVKNHFVRCILKFMNIFLCWIIEGLERKVIVFEKEQQKIQEALKGLSSGKLNSTIKLLEKNSQPLIIRVESVGAIGENLYLYDIWHDAQLVDLINTLKEAEKTITQCP